MDGWMEETFVYSLNMSLKKSVSEKVKDMAESTKEKTSEGCKAKVCSMNEAEIPTGHWTAIRKEENFYCDMPYA